MMLNNLTNYTTLIQLISAVNFAYIFTRFHQKVYELIFDEKKLIDNKFTAFTNDMSADVESLQLMDPIETTKGTSNAPKLEEIKNAFGKLESDWEAKKGSIIKTLQKVKNAKGVRSLFLYISLFCLVDLFNISTIHWCEGGFWEQFTVIFSMSSIITPAILTYKIIFFKWEEKHEVLCYKWTSCASFITIISSLILTIVNYCFVGWAILTDTICIITFLLSLILPFYVCAFSILYIVGYEQLIKYRASNGTKEVRKRQKNLHNDKIALDASYSMFTTTPPDFR